MNKPELLRTGNYLLTMEEENLRISDLRTADFRFISKESLSMISNMGSEEFDDYALELFDV